MQKTRTLKTHLYSNRKEHKMQEVISKLLNIHDMKKGDEPPKDGWYLVLNHTVESQVEVSNLYWHKDAKAWSVDEDNDTLHLVTEYWGYLWAEDTLTKAVKDYEMCSM